MSVTKSKFVFPLLCSLSLSLLLFGCVGCAKKESTGTVAKTGTKEETLLFTTKTETNDEVKTSTVSFGDFSGVLQLEGTTLLPVETHVICDVDYGSMIYDECYVKPWDFVEEGQVLAKVHMDVDPIQIQEKKYELDRMAERFTYSQEQQQKEIDEFAKKMYSEKDEPKQKKMEVQYEDLCAKKEYDKAMYDISYTELTEEIADMEEAATITSITAPEAGVILTISDIDTQTTLTNGQLIFTMAPFTNLYITADNTSGQFLTNMSVNIEASTDSGSIETTGTVVSASAKGISSDFPSNLAYIRLDEPNMEVYTSNNITISASIKNLSHMLLVDSNAVTIENGFGYVTVLNEDGSLTKTKFEFSLSNSKYFVISKGLEEGTTVIVN